MSWYYESDYPADDFADVWGSYLHARFVNDDVYPFEHHPFRQLVDAAIGYMETQAEIPLYDAALFEFMDIAAGAVGCLHWERELKFHQFLQLPTELQFRVYDYYLQDGGCTGNLQKYQHADPAGNACCIWRWPSELTMCDRNAGKELGLYTPKYAPWLPSLAFANKRIFGELTIYMLQTTEWFELFYNGYKPFKIVPWFTQFLSTFHKDEAFKSIKRIDFPNAYRYNECRAGKVIDEQNPDVQLMLRCTNLDTIAMTFEWLKLIAQDRNGYWDMIPRDLDDFLEFYQLHPMLEHKSVKRVYLAGIHPYEEEGDTLQCLDEFAKWIVKGFEKKQGRVVDVYMHKRNTTFAGRAVGTKMVFEDE